MIINLVIWAIFGALAGWIASLIMRTNEEQGALTNVVVGVAGALIGGFIVQTLGGSGITGINLPSLIIAVVGSVALLAIVRAFVRS